MSKRIENRIRDCRPLGRLIFEYYERPDNGAGGWLHVVLDDGNYETEHVEYCRAAALENGDFAGAAIARLLLMCSITQRRKANRIAHGLTHAKYHARWGT